MTITFPKIRDSFPKCQKHYLEVKATQGEHVPDAQRETKTVRTKKDYVIFNHLDYWSTYIIEIMISCDGLLVEHTIEDQDTGPGSKLVVVDFLGISISCLLLIVRHLMDEKLFQEFETRPFRFSICFHDSTHRICPRTA